ncbi:MAG: hypothetical protein AB1846_17665 [Chloroflexota bacterium]
MDEQRFHQKPWFFFFITILGLGILYLLVAPTKDTILKTLWANKGDYFLCLGGFLLWLAFFAQFVLPVRKFRDRQKIFDRLLNSVLGVRGPAIFIENGNPRLSHEEEKRKGAGVIWLDTASGAVLRVATKFTRAVGPGVVFTNAGEKLAASVDLHTQNQPIGPSEKDDPFAKEKKEGQSEEEFMACMNRRDDTIGLTRDGIEIVPNISVMFRIEADPAKDKEPGSRFGYNEDSVFRAIAGQGINPDKSNDSARYRVAWNELPARLAADLWREYLSKFTLAELFDPIRPIPEMNAADITATRLSRLPQPAKAELPEPIGISRTLYQFYQVINGWLEKLIALCEKEKSPPPKKESAQEPKTEGKAPEGEKPTTETAMQVIARMVNERLQNEFVQGINEFGEWESVFDSQRSREFEILRNRGIRVNRVTIANLRFRPDVDKRIVQQFTANWLDNARRERDRIESERSLSEHEGRERALVRYTTALSREILRSRPASPEAALQALLRGSRSELIRDNNLRRRVSNEVEDLTALLQWVDKVIDGQEP